MIKNDRQYRLTRAQAERFARALECLHQQDAEETSIPAALRQAETAALESQLADLRAQLADYEALRQGKRRALTPVTLEELPQALIQARIAAGWSHRELAQRLGLKEQQVQRYEATDYAATSLERVQKIARILGVRLNTPANEPHSEVRT